jgi:hypothetical protein
MKKVLILFFCSFSLLAISQVKPKSTLKSKRVSNPEVSNQNHANINNQTPASPYFIDELKLSSYFIDNKIPFDFPKNNTALSKEENKKIALEWSKAHSDLFKSKYKNELENNSNLNLKND